MSGNVTITNEVGAEAAGFAASVDLDRAPAGTPFQATWTFTNSGSVPWNGRYRLAYTLTRHEETVGYPAAPMSDRTAWTLQELGVAEEVPPGGTVQLTVPFTVPDTSGTYATNWQLQTPDGRRFGPVRWMRVVVADAGEFAYSVIDFTNSAVNFENMKPGQQFTAVWKLQNTGTAVWSGDFQAVYMAQTTSGTEDAVCSQMGAPDALPLRQLTGREQIAPGETAVCQFRLTAPAEPGAYTFHWRLQDASGRTINGMRWLRIGVSGGASFPKPAPARLFQPGMNINPEVHDLDVDRLRGLDWVRYPFFASRLKLSPEQAYQQRYKRIIQSYAAAGIGSLLVLHQDTEWGNAPWDNGGWESYANAFAQTCGRVARACAEFSDKVAYQIFNEQDCPPSNPSAIPIPAKHFAPILDKAAQAIRAAHPGATIVIGGLNSGPDHAVQYVQEVQKRLGGRLPVDALAYHPYGRYVRTKVFHVFGPLSEVLDKFKAAFPDKPLWITEFGLPGHGTFIGPEHYPKIAQYLREITAEAGGKYAGYVQALIWFAWTDRMENAGILTADGRKKSEVYEAFLEMKNYGRSQAKSVFDEVDEATYLSYSSTLSNPNAASAGSRFTARWTFKNSGSTTWGDSYKVVYVPQGDNPAPMTAQTEYTLSEIAGKAAVQPGETAELKLEMTVPEAAGRTYRSRWQIRNPQGTAFAHFYEEITVVAAPVTSGARSAGMTFIDDQTYRDNTRVVAGTDFDKQWRVKNSGGRQWGSGFRLVYVEGDLQLLRGVATHMTPRVKPGEIATLTVPMTAPPPPDGRATPYRVMLRMQDDRGNWFGDPLWAVIVSVPAVAPGAGDTALSRLLNDPFMWHSQVDPRWKNEQLGNGAATIGTWGCLMTCMAMTLTAFGTPLNPSEMNRRAREMGQFDGSSIKFAAPAAIGGLRYKGNARSWKNRNVPFSIWAGDPIQRIDTALAAGDIVLAQVDTKPNNGFYDNNSEQHWVIIVKRTSDGRDYLIIDPLTPPQNVQTQPRSLMSKYGSPKPSASNETNLRTAIISTLVYHQPGGQGS